jgi:hypothetical protein
MLAMVAMGIVSGTMRHYTWSILGYTYNSLPIFASASRRLSSKAGMSSIFASISVYHHRPSSCSCWRFCRSQMTQIQHIARTRPTSRFFSPEKSQDRANERRKPNDKMIWWGLHSCSWRKSQKPKEVKPYSLRSYFGSKSVPRNSVLSGARLSLKVGPL